jgi:hypothetical protein
MATGRQDRGDVPFPVRGIAGGWRDWWDEPDDSAVLRSRVEAAEAHLLARVAITGRRWQRQRPRELARKRRGRSGCPYR